MKVNRKEWTEEEVQILLTNKKCFRETAEQLGRERMSVYNKAHRLRAKGYDVAGFHYMEGSGAKPRGETRCIDSTMPKLTDIFVEDVYFDLYRWVPIGATIIYEGKSDSYTSNEMIQKRKGIIVEKYPFYCKVVDTNIVDMDANNKICVQWSDVARFNRRLIGKEED